MADSCLIDSYRKLNPDSKRFTWRRRNPIKRARLDLFLILETLLNNFKNANIEPSYRSDHAMISINLSFSDFKRGKGIWNFYNSLLEDISYSDFIKKKITDTKIRYALPCYNLENIDKIPNSEMQLNINNQTILEVVLMKTRGGNNFILI